MIAVGTRLVRVRVRVKVKVRVRVRLGARPRYGHRRNSPGGARTHARLITS